MDSSCPTCDYLLAIVSYSADKEFEADSESKAYNRFYMPWKKSILKSETGLPELEDSLLTLTWDFEEYNSNSRFTVIRHGEREI